MHTSRAWIIAIDPPPISGFANGIGAKAEGLRTIILAVIVDEQMAFVLVEDVLYVPSAGCNLFSPGLALDQGFQLSWELNKRMSRMTKDNMEVIYTTHERQLWTFTAHNIGCNISKSNTIITKQQVFANFAITDGVKDIDVWYERLGHTLSRQRKTFKKSLDRSIEKVNDMAFADLLIARVSNGSKFSAVLVIMDGFSRFVKFYLLKSMTGGERTTMKAPASEEGAHGQKSRI
ncbi:unnamed protein product [Peronospora belbahrii]|uniref:Uncharacterized protein n=1 Tax=Peronospora belbahrii TaxID=622444 RepID=A0ABN8D421_9STRA|nr:unnamed protein product [Peronospora belbahrii]